MQLRSWQNYPKISRPMYQDSDCDEHKMFKENPGKLTRVLFYFLFVLYNISTFCGILILYVKIEATQ
jgi:hypothetical protein